jgi:hypothetical protein
MAVSPRRFGDARVVHAQAQVEHGGPELLPLENRKSRALAFGGEINTGGQHPSRPFPGAARPSRIDGQQMTILSRLARRYSLAGADTDTNADTRERGLSVEICASAGWAPPGSNRRPAD